MRKPKASIKIVCALSVFAFVSSARGEEPGKLSNEGSRTEAPKAELNCGEQLEMGTPFKVCVYVNPAERLSVSYDISKAFRRLREMNSWMSEWIPGTQLSQINEAAGARPVKVGKDLFELLKWSMEVSKNTEGAFDPTFNAFWGLYNFKSGFEREPTDAEIKERLSLINWQNVVLDEKEQTVFLKSPGMKLGFGGLGQGYGVDRVVGELKKHYSAGYVDGSGDTYFWGVKPDGSKWITGVRDPRDKNKVLLRLYGTDFAITTSGDDEKYFMKGGRRVHHIIDPKTGRPSTASRQVTVIASRALDADSYDTGAFVMGPKKGKELIERLGLRGVFVTEDGFVLTKGLAKKQTQWGEVYEIDGTLN